MGEDQDVYQMIGFLRLLLGAGVILLGLNHWPHFLPPTEPGSALSAQLVAAFADTGLTGFAAAVLLLSGAFIIANRLTVLALVLTTPILVCGAFWAIFLEGKPVLILAALAGLAGAGMLLLAYWPHVRQLFDPRAKSAVEDGTDTSPLWRRTEVISRYVWGLWFVGSGLYHFVTPPIYGDRPLAVQLITALVDTGLYEVVKGVEFLGGATVLFRRWAPLGLLVNAPIETVVLYWDGCLQGQFGVFGLFIVATTLFFTLVMLRAYRAYYLPVLAWRPVHIGRAAADPVLLGGL